VCVCSELCVYLEERFVRTVEAKTRLTSLAPHPETYLDAIGGSSGLQVRPLFVSPVALCHCCRW
jgi:hypothetical protein